MEGPGEKTSGGVAASKQDAHDLVVDDLRVLDAGDEGLQEAIEVRILLPLTTTTGRLPSASSALLDGGRDVAVDVGVDNGAGATERGRVHQPR